MRKLLLLLLSWPCLAFAAPPLPASDASLTDTCSQLGQIAYWAATAHLAQADERRLNEARSDALRSNQLRSALPKHLVEYANSAGAMSHGNAGQGLSSLEAARADAVIAAMDVYGRCLAGRLPAQAPSDWFKLTQSAEASVSYDRTSLRKTSVGSTIWTLTTFYVSERLDGKTYRSAKGQFEFNCKAERYRVLGTLFYEGAGASGKVVSTTSEVEPWAPIAPGTMAQTLMAVACVR